MQHVGKTFLFSGFVAEIRTGGELVGSKSCDGRKRLWIEEKFFGLVGLLERKGGEGQEDIKQCEFKELSVGSEIGKHDHDWLN